MRAMALGIMTVFGLALSIAALANDPSANRIQVAIMGLRNNNGVVRCGLYSSPGGFPKPGREFRGVSAPIQNRQATCVFGDVPAGRYAVAVFHAESDEAQMQYGLFGIPKEGYGFSRKASGTFGPPGFSDAAFDYKGGDLDLQIGLSY